MDYKTWGEVEKAMSKSLGFTAEGEYKSPIIDVGNFDECVVDIFHVHINKPAVQYFRR